MQISGFTIVRNATRLDFPLEPSLRSLLPVVSELIVNVGQSDDDTLDRVRSIGDPRIRIIESRWDRGRGTAMLADETQRAMAACRSPWGIYIQADEVFADDGAHRVAEAIERHDADRDVEGVLVEYVHFYGGFDTVARNRKWYRREVRAVRLDAALGVHSYRDAQGFRVGLDNRRIRAVASGAVMHHYGWARPAWALANKRVEDRALDPERRHVHDGRPLLPWIPGIAPFRGEHPAIAREWIAARRSEEQLIAPAYVEGRHLRLRALGLLERLTGWRPFEFRNYDNVRAG
jgi:glycosyltransferase involved in cell wall biosynthesis